MKGSISAKDRQVQKPGKATIEVKLELREDATVTISNLDLLGHVLTNWGIDACRPLPLCDLESLSRVLLEWRRPTTLTLRPKKEQQEDKIVKALKKGKTVRDQLKLSITDDAGNTETEKLKFALKRQLKKPGKKR